MGKLITRSQDPYFNNVELLLHLNGTNGSQSFVDSSKNNFSITTYGDAQISTAQSKFGGSSAYFDGDGDYLTIQASEAFNYGSGDFTIEFWVKPLDGPYSTYDPCFFTNHSNGEWNLTGKGIRIHHQNAIFSTDAVDFVELNFNNQIQNDTWNHLAIVRNGNTITAYLNGVNNGSVSFMGSLGDSSDSIGIALSDTLVPGGREFLNGYIDELRITKGIARYTSNFTPLNKQFYDGTIEKNISIKKQNLGGGKLNLGRSYTGPTAPLTTTLGFYVLGVTADNTSASIYNSYVVGLGYNNNTYPSVLGALNSSVAADLCSYNLITNMIPPTPTLPYVYPYYGTTINTVTLNYSNGVWTLRLSEWDNGNNSSNYVEKQVKNNSSTDIPLQFPGGISLAVDNDGTWWWSQFNTCGG